MIGGRAIVAITSQWLEANGVVIVVAILTAIVLSLIARFAMRRLGRRLGERRGAFGGRRMATVTNSALSIVLVLIWAVTVLVVLAQVGVNLAPLFAAAGIAGIAIGFGAQTIVRDSLSGFFILTENQFDLGDTIEALTTAGRITGRIEGFTFRVTSIRAYDGTLHYVPNGNIQVVSNKSKGWARAIVDVRIAHGEDVDRVKQILSDLFDELRRDPSIAGWLKEGPDVLGVEVIAADALVIRTIADTRPAKRADVERLMRERISSRLGERGVKVPAGSAGGAAAPPPA